MTTLQFNPLDPSMLDDPFDTWKELREKAPVTEFSPNFYYIARYQDAVDVFRNFRSFSNDWLPVSGMFGAEDPEMEKTVQEMDPPRHGPIRRLYLTALAPAKVAAAGPHVSQLCRELVGASVAKGSADLMEDLAIPVPSKVIMHMLGIPESDQSFVRPWIDAIIEGANPTTMISTGGMGFEQVRQHLADFNAYVDGLIAQRKNAAEPPDDLITRMLRHTDEEGHTFHDLEIRTQVRFAIMAGNETTTHLIGNLLYFLARDPALFERIRGDRALGPVFIEEMMRHHSPVQVMFRKCVVETVLEGVTIPAGAQVAIGIGSANRDERIYEHPEQVDIDRGECPAHLGFGTGAHLCVGAPLARLEAQHTLDAVLDLVPAMELAPGFTYEKVDFFFMRGPKRLDVVFPRS